DRVVAGRLARRRDDRLSPFRREAPPATRPPIRPGPAPRARLRRRPSGLSAIPARRSGASPLPAGRRLEDPRAALSAGRRETGRTAPGGDLLSRRLAPADAARLALQLLLPQLLRLQSVPREPRLRRALGQLPQRHRLRHGVPGGARLRRGR